MKKHRVIRRKKGSFLGLGSGSGSSSKVVDAEFREVDDSKEQKRLIKERIKAAKKLQDELNRQQKSRETEAKRRARINKDLKVAEIHQAAAKKFEALARERKAKRISRRRSLAGGILRSLSGAASIKPRRKRRTRY